MKCFYCVRLIETVHCIRIFEVHFLSRLNIFILSLVPKGLIKLKVQGFVALYSIIKLVPDLSNHFVCSADCWEVVVDIVMVDNLVWVLGRARTLILRVSFVFGFKIRVGIGILLLQRVHELQLQIVCLSVRGPSIGVEVLLRDL